MIQVGTESVRVFMIGGGDYKALPDSMFQCRELIKPFDNNKFAWQFKNRRRMQYARHGHSVCALLDRYIIVTGSRKEVSLAAQKAELYDTQVDEWIEVAPMNEGRHYHTSCNFSNKYVYIFGGKQNAS
jgi:hypothetical protein